MLYSLSVYGLDIRTIKTSLNHFISQLHALIISATAGPATRGFSCTARRPRRGGDFYGSGGPLIPLQDRYRNSGRVGRVSLPARRRCLCFVCVRGFSVSRISSFCCWPTRPQARLASCAWHTPPLLCSPAQQQRSSGAWRLAAGPVVWAPSDFASAAQEDDDGRRHHFDC